MQSVVVDRWGNSTTLESKTRQRLGLLLSRMDPTNGSAELLPQNETFFRKLICLLMFTLAVFTFCAIFCCDGD